MVDIAAHRSRLNWSQIELANRSGVSARTIRRAEAGETLAPDSFRKILAALSIDPDLEQDSDETIEESRRRIQEMSHVVSLTVGQFVIFFLFTLGLFSFLSYFLLRDGNGAFPPGPFLYSSILVPFSMLLLWRHDNSRYRLRRDIEPDCERLIRAIENGRLQILDHSVYRVLSVLKWREFTAACNSTLASVRILHPEGSFGLLGAGANVHYTGKVPQHDDTGSRSLTTRKEVAWKAGIDPKTLRRLEQGAPVSAKTQKLFNEIATDPGTLSGKAEERYATALQDVSDAFHGSVMFWAEFSSRFMIPAFGILLAAALAHLVDSGMSLSLFKIVVLGLLTSALAVAIWFVVRGKQERRKIVERTKPTAMTILDGIRIGAVRHLSRQQYKALSLSLSERRLAEALEVAPSGVRVL